jgi:drug/metabolite transporter (DMT)-like permease
MSGRTVQGAMLLLVIGNLLAITSDIIIKWVSGEVALFQFVAMRLVVTLLLLAPFIGLVDRQQLFAGAPIHLLRAHVGLFGIVCMVFALGALPLATANAIFYAAPVLVLILGALFFGERLRPGNVVTVVLGFVGVLVILRPDQLSLAGLSALGLAVALAITAVLVRKLPRHQSVVHSLLLNYLFALPAALALAWFEGAPLDLSALNAAFGSALFILGYNMTVLLAYRHVDAGRVTAAEYTGLIWAFVLGWLIFAELPDAGFWIGASLIAGPLLIQALRSGRTQGQRRLATAVGGSRRATDFTVSHSIHHPSGCGQDEAGDVSRPADDRGRACDGSPAPAPAARCSGD